jgi:hypothetical protein
MISFDRIHWFFQALLLGGFLAAAIPTALMVAPKLWTETLSDRQIIELAAANFGNHLAENPLRTGWKLTSLRVTSDLRLVADVKVILRRHAEIIKSRNARIKYSYLKLACPPTDAAVFTTLLGEKTLWIRLYHQGDTLIEAGCPKAKSIVSIY